MGVVSGEGGGGAGLLNTAEQPALCIIETFAGCLLSNYELVRQVHLGLPLEEGPTREPQSLFPGDRVLL